MISACPLWLPLVLTLSFVYVDSATVQGGRGTDLWYLEKSPWPPMPYAFGYELRDEYGNQQYRKEKSTGKRVTGSYGYYGPDGVFRHVDYIADEDGFRANIRTNEPGVGNADPASVRINPKTYPPIPPYPPGIPGPPYTNPPSRIPPIRPPNRGIDSTSRRPDIDFGSRVRPGGQRPGSRPGGRDRDYGTGIDSGSNRGSGRDYGSSGSLNPDRGPGPGQGSGYRPSQRPRGRERAEDGGGFPGRGSGNSGGGSGTNEYDDSRRRPGDGKRPGINEGSVSGVDYEKESRGRERPGSTDGGYGNTGVSGDGSSGSGTRRPGGGGGSGSNSGSRESEERYGERRPPPRPGSGSAQPDGGRDNDDGRYGGTGSRGSSSGRESNEPRYGDRKGTKSGEDGSVKGTKGGGRGGYGIKGAKPTVKVYITDGPLPPGTADLPPPPGERPSSTRPLTSDARRPELPPGPSPPTQSKPNNNKDSSRPSSGREDENKLEPELPLPLPPKSGSGSGPSEPILPTKVDKEVKVPFGPTDQQVSHLKFDDDIDQVARQRAVGRRRFPYSNHNPNSYGNDPNKKDYSVFSAVPVSYQYNRVVHLAPGFPTGNQNGFTEVGQRPHRRIGVLDNHRRFKILYKDVDREMEEDTSKFASLLLSPPVIGLPTVEAPTVIHLVTSTTETPLDRTLTPTPLPTISPVISSKISTLVIRNEKSNDTSTSQVAVKTAQRNAMNTIDGLTHLSYNDKTWSSFYEVDDIHVHGSFDKTRR